MELHAFVYYSLLRRERVVIFAKNWEEAMALGLDAIESPNETMMVRCHQWCDCDESTA
tara:strand:+ start:647 stop:820 length:174 start_codon:yes stop_codon:yes gene_type:complete